MKINIINLFIFTGVIQGFIFGIFIFTSPFFKSKINRFLALTIITLSLSNLNYWFIDTGLEKKYSLIDIVYLPWNLIFPVFFYCYVSEYYKNYITNKKFIILSLPFILSSLYHIFIKINSYGLNKTEYFSNVSLFYSLEEYFAIVITIISGIKAYTIITEKKTDLLNSLSWLIDFLKAGLILIIIWITVYSASLIFNFYKSWIFYPLWIGLSILFYWIGYRGVFQFKLIKERFKINELREIYKQSNIENKEETSEKIKNKNNSTFIEENPLFVKFENLIQEKHLYRDPSLSLESVSEELNISSGYLSQIVNKITKKNFSDYINTYRIEEIKKMLVDPEFEKYSLLAIGLEAGFNSKTSFYTVFKKHVGLTPKQYKDKNHPILK
ncbi:hypothetical protein UJ101_02550 [Flavobacteriaceae bacterium UJ101]|nr:hypothetical protein UJ101_02550 [Flavobacteriaceae bacterium UJ101]